jgi:hypothetical protein
MMMMIMMTTMMMIPVATPQRCLAIMTTFLPLGNLLLVLVLVLVLVLARRTPGKVGK